MAHPARNTVVAYACRLLEVEEMDIIGAHVSSCDLCRAIVTEADVTDDLRAVFYHCVGHDDSRRGEYVRFREAPPGVRLCPWIHTPGLCGGWADLPHGAAGGCDRRP